MKKLLVAILVLAALAFSQERQNGPKVYSENSGNWIEIPNSGSGTTQFLLAKRAADAATTITTTASDADLAIGPVMAGAGTTGNAQVCTTFYCTCTFDGATTADDYVQASVTGIGVPTAGNCHDVGATLPTNGHPILGRVTTTNGGGGNYSYLVYAAIPGVATAGTVTWCPVNMVGGTTAVGFAPGGANTISGYGFMTGSASCTFGSIYFNAQTADASGLYSMNIVDSSGNIVCHPAAGIHITTSPILNSVACTEGTVILAARSVYVLVATGNATVARVYGSSANGSILPFMSTAVAGCSSASGVLSGTCTISLAATTPTGTVPAAFLH